MGDVRARWLLGLALALAVVRFVLVPWTSAQVEQKQRLELLTARLDRSVGVVFGEKSILEAQGKVTAAAAETRSRFPEVVDKEHFRLDVQRQLAAIASRGGVKVGIFDWIVDGSAQEAALEYGRVSTSLEGPLDNLVAVHGQIEGEMPFAAIREVRVELGRGESGLTATPARISLVMDLFYRHVPKPSAAGSGEVK